MTPGGKELVDTAHRFTRHRDRLLAAIGTQAVYELGPIVESYVNSIEETDSGNIRLTIRPGIYCDVYPHGARMIAVKHGIRIIEDLDSELGSKLWKALTEY